MLQVRSFKMSDEKGINECLKTYRLAAGANMLISNGEVCIPIEDGEPMTKNQQILEILERRYSMEPQYKDIVHSQVVNEMRNKEARKKIQELEQELVLPNNKESYDKAKEIKDEIKRLESFITNNENVIINNKGEIARLEANFKVFDEKVAELRA